MLYQKELQDVLMESVRVCK